MRKNESLNLKNVVKVGFIPNFNTRQGYPEFGRTIVNVVKAAPIAIVKKIKVLSGGNQEVKIAKKDPNNKHGRKWALLVKAGV